MLEGILRPTRTRPRSGIVRLDPQSDFQFAYSKVPSSEIARCKPLDRTAISEELRRLWDALSDDQRKVYDQKADELRGEMARERLIAARTARDRAVEAALELGAKDRDARLIAARQTKQLFPDVDWEQLVKPSSPRSSELPPTPSTKALISELEGSEPAFDDRRGRPGERRRLAPRTYSESPPLPQISF